MNNTFNIKRFFKVMAYDFNLVLAKYFKNMLPIALIVYLSVFLISFVLFGGMTGPIVRSGISSFIIFIVIFGVPYVVYKDINNRNKGVVFATYPASIYEKFLSMFLYSVIILPIITITAIYITDEILVLFSSLVGRGFVEHLWTFNEYFEEIFMWQSLLSILTLTAISITGNVFFRSNKILKTILALFIINIIFSFVFMLSMMSIVENPEPFIEYIQNFQMIHNSNPDLLEAQLESNLISLFRGAVLCAFVVDLGLLTASFFKLKNTKY